MGKRGLELAQMTASDVEQPSDTIDGTTPNGCQVKHEISSNQVDRKSSTENSSEGEDMSRKAMREPSVWQRMYEVLTYVPQRCRYDPSKPFEFSMSLNILFAFAGCFTVANLYYTHPILNLLARDFNVTNEQASHIPTLAQAGYAAGMLFLCPPADLVKRRPFVLWLVWFTATMWIGLCITTNYAAFCAITFITGWTTVTPQLMLPLIGDLAPPHRRATALSVVVSGLLLGMLVARLLSGIVALYIGWRYIYWIAFALQYLILILLWLFMPDYPSKNEGMEFWKSYPVLLWDVIRIPFRHPVIMQACLVGLCTSSTFTNYWTTLTFLLAGPPYQYNSLLIGLFALTGIVMMIWGPLFARTVMDKHQPQFSVMIGLLIGLTGIVIGTYTGKINVAGPIIQAICLDVGLQTSQIGNRQSIYGVDPKARNRQNSAYMIAVFIGQLIGTALGNAVYARAGWVASGSTALGFICLAIFFCLCRGPHEKGWMGWSGGLNMSVPGKQGVDSESTQDTYSSKVEALGEMRRDEKHFSEDDEKTHEVPDSSLTSSSSTSEHKVITEKRSGKATE